MSPGVIPFPRSNRMGDDEAQLDKAGQTILQLLNKTADGGGAKRQARDRYGAEASHKLSAAEARIAGLEAEVARYREQAERAEQGLHRVHTEIEEQFLRQRDDHRESARRSQGGANRR
jgi:hypothetical protein